MSILKKLASQTAVYGLSSVLGRMLNYLLVPLYTSVFLPAEYGIVTELYAYVAFLNILFIYGLETAYFRFSSQGKGYNYFNLAFTSILISSFVFSGVIWLLSDSIAQILEYPNKAHFIRWLAAILAIDAIVAIPFARLRQIGKAYRFAVFKLSNIGINIFLNVFFIVLCPLILTDHPESFIRHIYNPDLGVGYVFLSNLIANGLYLLFFYKDWLKVKLTFNAAEWKRMMKYAWPVLIIGFSGVTNEMLSRAILKYRLPEGFYEGYTNLEILGIFGACYKLSVFMTLAVQAFRYAFEPFFFAQAKKKNSPQVFSRVMTMFVLFTSFSWLVLCVFMPYYAPIFLRQESYLMALDAVPWLLGGGLFLGVFYNLSLWYKLTDKTLYGAYISLIGAFATFILNWSLIPVMGYMGSAIATFGSYLIMVFISYWWGMRHYAVPYQLGRTLSYVLFAGAGILINGQFEQSVSKSVLIVLIFLTLPIIFERESLFRKRS
ncbi:Membrane protein involved in the export of O-antigen and teichoic acid [Ekhidna lutea]|uniref:Membrane protein involved in the export of O-antigen and teichoic acid n=1 Tax=Ekhidna lutea TaxID=447679 RepID=A0A239IVB5_EKHLU|nr:polysaccharide biosynthesis C-terminal domain-containing protein [Ekhidna lutea]SNS97322.1 Membrane protein involved in the export of O-antigen and teichoic acid [Ekhidna lutea]